MFSLQMPEHGVSVFTRGARIALPGNYASTELVGKRSICAQARAARTDLTDFPREAAV